MTNIGLMITPGIGHQDLAITSGTTLGQLVGEQNLHGRSISVDGEEVAPENYDSTILKEGADVWATGGAKGA